MTSIQQVLTTTVTGKSIIRHSYRSPIPQIIGTATADLDGAGNAIVNIVNGAQGKFFVAVGVGYGDTMVPPSGWTKIYNDGTTNNRFVYTAYSQGLTSWSNSNVMGFSLTVVAYDRPCAVVQFVNGPGGSSSPNGTATRPGLALRWYASRDAADPATLLYPDNATLGRNQDVMYSSDWDGDFVTGVAHDEVSAGAFDEAYWECDQSTNDLAGTIVLYGA